MFYSDTIFRHRGWAMSVRLGHQPDHLDQRRRAGAGRRHAARDLPRRDQAGGLCRHRARRQIPARRRRAAADPGQRTGWTLVSGWYDGRIAGAGGRGRDGTPSCRISRCCATWAAGTWSMPTPRAGAENDLWGPISRRPRLADGRLAGLRPQAHGARRAHGAISASRMAFHHHMGTIVETDAEVGLLMRHTGEAVGLLYDTGHCVFAGGDPVALVEAPCRPDRPRPLQGRPRRVLARARAPTT